MVQKILFWLGIALMLGMSAYYFQNLWQQPNGFMGVQGDGYKNYATVEYHVKNDTSFHHFQGMNYPYGDHIAFADAQPIIANSIKVFSHHIYDVSDHTRTILHAFLIASFFLTFWFIYLIFRRLEIEKGFASLSAGAISWLSPQLARWDEHYALGYTFVIPLFLYLLILFHQKRSIWISVAIGFALLLVAQIHLYHLGIIVLFVSLFHALDFFFSEKINKQNLIKRLLSSGIAYSIQIVFPVSFIALYWLKIGDTVLDRPSVPGGFLTYRALWQGLFSHPNSIFHSFYAWQKSPMFSSMENVVYLGIAVILGIISLLLAKKTFAFQLKNPLSLLLLASLPLFLLALGLPFIISDWEKWLNYTGGLQQFRGVGRFAWVFFYLINIFVFYKIEKKYLLFLIAIAWFDAIYLYRVPLSVLPQDFFDNKIQKADFEKNIDWRKYQAILPLPYFSVGSEQFDMDAQGYTLPYTFIFSIEKNLPLIASQMSRTSFEQAYQAQCFASFYNNQKPLFLEKIDSKKPILIIQNKEVFATDTIYERWNGFLVKKIAENKVLRFYEMEINDFQAASNIEKEHKFLPKMYLYNDNIVFNQRLELQKANQKYVLSFDWFCEKQPQPLLEYHIKEIDSATGKVLHFIHYGCRYRRKNMNNEHFVSCEIPFETWFENTNIEVTLFYHNAPKNVELVVRDLEISPEK